MKQKDNFSFLTLCTVAITLLAGLQFMMTRLQPTNALAQSTSAITRPAEGSTVSGLVSISGTAVGGTFQRYELYAKPSDAADDTYLYLSAGNEEVFDGELGSWDTTNLEPGLYDLRLRVVRLDGNYAEYFARGLRVVAVGALPAPTLAPTISPTLAVTSTVVITTNTSITATAIATVTGPLTGTTTVTPTVAPLVTATVAATATAAPTPTAIAITVEPAAVARIVTDRNINVRSGPGTNYEVTSGLSVGGSAIVTGQSVDGSWWQIETDGGNGWVLGLLVTAENVADVPVIDVEADVASTATPTPTAEPEAPIVAPEDATDEPVLAPAPISISRLVTVTFAGEEDDPDALRTLLGTLLADVSPGNGAITVTIGALPDPLPIEATLPQTMTVLGGVVRTGLFESSQIYLTSPGEGTDLLAAAREVLLTQAFTDAPQDLMNQPNEVFLSTDQLARPIVLCSPDETALITLSTLALAGTSDVVSLAINPISGGSPCDTTIQQDDQGIFGLLPRLQPVAETAVRSTGGGSGSSNGGMMYVSAEAEIEGNLSIAELTTHYADQLEENGWTQIDESQTAAISWSAWRFVDAEENAWNATFYIVEQGGEENSYLATLRAENVQ